MVEHTKSSLLLLLFPKRSTGQQRGLHKGKYAVPRTSSLGSIYSNRTVSEYE